MVLNSGVCVTLEEISNSMRQDIVSAMLFPAIYELWLSTYGSGTDLAEL